MRHFSPEGDIGQCGEATPVAGSGGGHGGSRPCAQGRGGPARG